MSASPTTFVRPPSDFNEIKNDNIQSSKRRLDFVQKQEKSEIDQTISSLKRLVDNGSFSTSNILYKLLQDSLNWHACENISSMRYSDAVKEFFWTGRRLLMGQFLRFMRGYGHSGMVTHGKAQRGMYSPRETDINLPVPSDKTLTDYKPYGIEITRTLEPGIIQENIDLYSKEANTASFGVMFDGKKIVPNSADVFLLGEEDEPKLAEVKASFEDKGAKICSIVDIIEGVEAHDCEKVEQLPNHTQQLVLRECKSLLHDLADISRSLRETQAKKKSYLVSLERKFAETEDWKFKFAINKIRTLLYQINICLNDLLGEVNVILHCCAALNNAKRDFILGDTCSLQEQGNYLELKSPDEVRKSCCISPNEDIQPNLLKQRTPEWFSLRKSVKVTGSVMQKAVGLNTLSAQREYFDTVIGGKTEPPVNDIQKKAMDYGSRNEENAVSTLVSKVVPAYYPGYTFYEEGAYVVKNASGQNIIIVSPDGSLRKDNNVVSVEIKCPCPQYSGVTPVFYEVKERHVVQSLSEAHVLDANEHLYISCCPQSTTVFRMQRNTTVVNKVINEVNDLYYADVPIRPTRISAEAKEIKANVKAEVVKAELLCEVPSTITENKHVERKQSNSPYHEVVETTLSHGRDITIENLAQALIKCKKTVIEAYNFQKPVAAEVMIYLLSDMDRIWKNEIGHGLPVAFLYKGYSFPMTTSRRILDNVLGACNDQNIHVACVSFDGQFAALKDYDSEDNPLTLFACQRRYWMNVVKMSKKELIDAVCQSFSKLKIQKEMVNVFDEVFSHMVEKYVASNDNQNQTPIRSHPDLIYKKMKVSSEVEHSQQIDIDTNGLDEEVTEILQTVLSQNNSECDVNETRATTTSTTDVTGLNTTRTTELTDSNSTNTTDVTSSYAASTADVSHSFDNHVPQPILTLDDDDFQKMYNICNEQSKSFNVESAMDFKTTFVNADKMNQNPKGQVLQQVLNYVNVKLTKYGITIKNSLRKAQKINKMCEVLGITSRLNEEVKLRKPKQVKTLKAMCIDGPQKKSYPKDAIAVAYAEACWHTEEINWYESSNTYVSKEVCIVSSDTKSNVTFSPLYSPEYVPKTGHVQVRVMDGTHMRTNIKAKLIRSGLEDLKVAPWKEVALGGNTTLPLAMLEVHNDGKIMHQQSDPHFRTMVSEDVEIELNARGYIKEAKFCHLFREWHEAEDKPGLLADERVHRSIRLRKWLLEGYRFDKFPPVTQYVRGIPRVTYEGLVCSIDAHILLYSICKGGTYNWRSVSTLVAENFMGEIAERSQNNHGVPSGVSLCEDMTKISELHAMRFNPNRSFQMLTAKSRRYAVPKIDTMADEQYPSEQNSGTLNVQNSKIASVTLRNHGFDYRSPGKVKVGSIRKFGQQPRGVQSVRAHYKVDESKILPSIALGLPEDMVEIKI